MSILVFSDIQKFRPENEMDVFHLGILYKTFKQIPFIVQKQPEAKLEFFEIDIYDIFKYILDREGFYLDLSDIEDC